MCKTVDINVALPAEGVDRNKLVKFVIKRCHVALPAEGVDRNRVWMLPVTRIKVALPAEGVDRNYRLNPVTLLKHKVALPAEGVDRNWNTKARYRVCKSPSPRRAWIEMSSGTGDAPFVNVALPAEGVDRNR